MMHPSMIMMCKLLPSWSYSPSHSIYIQVSYANIQPSIITRVCLCVRPRERGGNRVSSANRYTVPNHRFIIISTTIRYTILILYHHQPLTIALGRDLRLLLAALASCRRFISMATCSCLLLFFMSCVCSALEV